MMPLQINDMLEKIDEVRTVFVMGQRSLPFLEELFHFLKEISPVLDEINSSIEETSNKMPRATTQLLSVSEATKLATTEILDLVDAVMTRIAEVRTLSEQGARLDTALADADNRILHLLRDNLNEGDAVLLADVEQLFQRKDAIRQKRATLYEPMFAGLGDVRDRINRIMISLQVQDITAQQIAAVNHLIESIRYRMDVLVSRINIPGADGAFEPAAAAIPGTFDPDAQYDHSPDRQSVADSVFTDRTNVPPPEDIAVVQPASDESGMLHPFSPAGIPSQSTNGHLTGAYQPGGDGYGVIRKARPNHRPQDTNISPTPEEKTSQDEIDRLFRGDI